MHGCGHDGHTTMLLAAARYLHETRRFDGTAYLIFQPGEEGYAGAKAMIADGLFERFPAEQVFALHNWPALAAGQDRHHARARRWRPPTASRSRSTGAAATARIRTRRSIRCWSPATSSRRRSRSSRATSSPIDTAVVSLCAMQAGNPGRDERHSRAREAGRHGADVPAGDAGHDREAAHRARALDRRGVRRARDAQVRAVYPATINHDATAAFAMEVAEALVGHEQRRAQPRPVDGLGGLLRSCCRRARARSRGSARAARRAAASCTTARYDFNDAVIPLGAGYLAALAETAMPLA